MPDLKTIILKSITFKNGKYGASGSNGGVLFIYGGTIIGENLIFDGNTAFDTSSPGGAVLHSTISVWILNSSYLKMKIWLFNYSSLSLY